jgi:hypothetical protein
LQAQLQSAIGQESDEQQFASLHEQLGHPEFPQLQPIANTHAKTAKKVKVFFIKLFLPDLYYTFLPNRHKKSVTHERHAVF